MHPRPALPVGSGLHADIRIAYHTRSAREVAQGEAEWRFYVPRLEAVYSRHGTTSYLARGGRWEGLGRAAGVRVVAPKSYDNPQGKPRAVHWYYAFSHQFPLDRPSPLVPGEVDNCHLTLMRAADGHLRYRFTLRGNGQGRGATDDSFVVELHSAAAGGKEIRTQLHLGWAPVLTVGLLPGDVAGDSYAPQNAMAGILALRRPRHAVPGAPLEGYERFTQRVGATRYALEVRWSTR